jgi:hypothetical protein
MQTAIFGGVMVMAALLYVAGRTVGISPPPTSP